MAVFATWSLRAANTRRVVEAYLEDGLFGYRCVALPKGKPRHTVQFSLETSREAALSGAKSLVGRLCQSRYKLTGQSVIPLLELQPPRGTDCAIVF